MPLLIELNLIYQHPSIKQHKRDNVEIVRELPYRVIIIAYNTTMNRQTNKPYANMPSELIERANLNIIVGS